MKYVSTRAADAEQSASFREILLTGLAPDGGLYVPEEYPQVDAGTLAGWRRTLTEQGYADLAHQVISLFIDDISSADLLAICRRAYAAERFGSAEIVPVTPLRDGRVVLAHLSNGPTAAFKDLAMALLAELFDYELASRGDWLTILGATSGDTGSAAEYAMRGREAISVVMLTPAGRMTPFQQAQMFSLDDPHIINVAVDGVFDDCQDLVKQVNMDAAFKAAWHIGAVNSINWGRILAQVVYYVASWLRVTGSDDQRVSFAVPTGNFGNILAGHVARRMGLPIETLLLVTNENTVLDEFFRTGVYRVRTGAEVYATSSPSMDISKASNFERFIHDLLGGDGAAVTELFADQLGSRGFFDLSGTPQFAQLRARFGFTSASSRHAQRVATIAELYRSEGVLIDPHTADAMGAALARLDELTQPVIVLETALPVKFADTITEAIGAPAPVPERFAGLSGAQRHVVDLPDDVQALKVLITERVVRPA